MAWEYTTVERHGRLAVVRFDRGDGLNPMSSALARELTAVARSFADDIETSVIVLTGSANGGFCAGRDLKDAEISARYEQPMVARRHASQVGPRLCAAWEQLEQLTICAIEKFAVGAGLALALSTDIRVMGEGAHFRAPEVPLGLSMSWGSIPRLVALVGPARTKQMLCMGDARVGAAQSLAWGLAQEVVPNGEALAKAVAMGEAAASMPPLAVRMTKTTVNHVALAAGRAMVHMDTDQLILTEHTADHREAVAAFREKRKPSFSGA
jgi:enoyl-CoA hydratase/carnithine racemase